MPCLATDSSVSRVKAPFAVEARKVHLTALEDLDEFRISGVGKNPAAATREEAAGVGKIRHLREIDLAMKCNDPSLACVSEKMAGFLRV